MWIIEYRELIKILTISDLKVKYQSSVLGLAWSLLNPLHDAGPLSGLQQFV